MTLTYHYSCTHCYLRYTLHHMSRCIHHHCWYKYHHIDVEMDQYIHRYLNKTEVRLSSVVTSHSKEIYLYSASVHFLNNIILYIAIIMIALS